MKRMLAPAVLIFLCAAASLCAQESHPWSVHARLDAFAFSVKAGAGYSFSDSFELDGTVGVCVITPTMIAYTLTAVHHLMPADGGLQLDIEYGLVQASLNAIQPLLDESAIFSAYWLPGTGVSIGYRFPSGHQISLWAEAGILCGYDMGVWQQASFMPNLGLEYCWRLP